MKKNILVILLGVSSYVLPAQEYFVKQYRVEKGLPSDIIKATAQDSLGYFWIATDEGLVKYDGLKFTVYREAMRSNYAKGFFTSRSGRLLAFSDLDLIEIKNADDTVVFESVCPVSRVLNDSSISYPKLLFEDIQGALWISESQSVVRIDHGSIKRYSFDLADRSPMFLRSFTFFEDLKNDFYVASFQGNVFRYNRATDTFERHENKLPPSIEYAVRIDNKLIVGTSEGVWEGDLANTGGLSKLQLKLKIPQTSYIRRLHDGRYFVATRTHNHFIADPRLTHAVPIKTHVNNANHVFESREHDLWISTNEGLMLMRENLFQAVDEKVADFIESITQDSSSGKIYYAIARTLYSFDPLTKTNTIVLDLPGGYFQALIAAPEGIWVANAFRVFLFADGKIKKQFDFSERRRFVTGIFRDSKGNIWVTIPGIEYVYCIDASMNLQRLSVPLDNESLVNVIREGQDGMYVASNGKHYLFFKSHSDSVFHDISAPLQFTTPTDFNIPDLLIRGDVVWLASSEGLLKFDRQKTERVNLGDHFTGLPVRTIAAHPGNKVITSNAFGMVLYDPATGSFDQFNEGSGLPSNTVVRFFVDRDLTVWVGTSNGLCYSTRPLTRTSMTSSPRFTQTLVNGKKILLHNSELEIDHGSFLSVMVSSITFPENEVTYQYRLLPNDVWETTTESELRFPTLQPGRHTLEVKAKKNGPYAWSNASHLSFIVAKPFWQKGWFYGACMAATLGVMGATVIAVNARNQKRNRELQSLVKARTHELQLRNEELVKLNLEKDNLIGIVAHDLKSPLNQIASLLNLIKLTGKVDEKSAGYLGHAEQSTERLNRMIAKILDVDAIESKQLNLTMEPLNFSDVARSVIDRYDAEASRKNISITRLIEPSLFVTADRNYIEQVLENLLSNAIKFSPLDRQIFVNLKSYNDNVICEVKDNGPGLSPSDQAKLFGKYQKLSARPTANEPSTGLGLSIVKKFVEAMQGNIWCESEIGNGASFFVSFTRTR